MLERAPVNMVGVQNDAYRADRSISMLRGDRKKCASSFPPPTGVFFSRGLAVVLLWSFL